MIDELGTVTNAQGVPISNHAIRYSACDALSISFDHAADSHVRPFYTLADQLFVEPQPEAVPDLFDLGRPIAMSPPEIAIARSHIGVWEAISRSNAGYALVLEDDVHINRGFGNLLDQAWSEMRASDRGDPTFDILYVSYEEVRNGSPKTFVSKNVFRPERGLWHLSGYVLSKKGAQTLLSLLPCQGPVDLWINQQFAKLDVRALRRSKITQRRDLNSTNTYSILPTLSRIGILNFANNSLFSARLNHVPMFAFGPPGSGLSSLAMAVSMLGYRCCSDFVDIPDAELSILLSGRSGRVFDAYINIGSLNRHLPTLISHYPDAKFIVLEGTDPQLLGALKDADVLVFPKKSSISSLWPPLCEHLELAPPNAPYPLIDDLGLRRVQLSTPLVNAQRLKGKLRHDLSPWVAMSSMTWNGIRVNPSETIEPGDGFEDDFKQIRPSRWIVRNDTFPGNLGLFRSENVSLAADGGLLLSVFEKQYGVRALGAAALCTRQEMLYGSFSVTLKASNVSGLVTGFFLHRNSPRQEIDVEIPGNQPDRVIVNVFYNPGTDGAKLDYGYRGTPAVLPLGFDASRAFHEYAIQWESHEIRWFVDGKLIHSRVIWEPTPIPHLPMSLHLNTWPTSSRELAGRLHRGALPSSTAVRYVSAIPSSIIKKRERLDNATENGAGLRSHLRRS